MAVGLYSITDAINGTVNFDHISSNGNSFRGLKCFAKSFYQQERVSDGNVFSGLPIPY